MANIKSSKKSIRKIAKRTLRNKAEKSRIKTASKKLEVLKEGGDAEAVKAAAKALMSVVDKAGKHGVWHENKVNRIKGRLTPLIIGADLKKSEEAVTAGAENAEAAEAVEAVETKEVAKTVAKKTSKAPAKKKTTTKKPVAKKVATKKTATTKAKKSSSKKSE